MQKSQKLGMEYFSNWTLLYYSVVAKLQTIANMKFCIYISEEVEWLYDADELVWTADFGQNGPQSGTAHRVKRLSEINKD